jgi:DNA-binding NarL/FixJ family response regulator
MSIKVILADDHAVLREGLHSMLEKKPGIQVIAEAEDGRRAVELALQLMPHVVVMDVGMQGLNGIEATRRIKANAPGIKVLALSMHDSKRLVGEMLKGGASGYLLKDCAFDELYHAICAVAANRSYLSSNIMDAVVRDYAGAVPTDSSVFSILTTREREVLQLLAEGKSVKEIASVLNVSVKTVETFRQFIKNKLGVYNIAQLTKLAIREGLTSVEG